MNFKALIPMLRTWDIQESISFYTDVLGFDCASYSEEWGWASLKREEVEIMLAVPNQHEESTSAVFSGSLYIKTNDVEDICFNSDRKFLIRMIFERLCQMDVYIKTFISIFSIFSI